MVILIVYCYVLILFSEKSSITIECGSTDYLENMEANLTKNIDRLQVSFFDRLQIDFVLIF